MHKGKSHACGPWRCRGGQRVGKMQGTAVRGAGCVGRRVRTECKHSEAAHASRAPDGCPLHRSRRGEAPPVLPPECNTGVHLQQKTIPGRAKSPENREKHKIMRTGTKQWPSSGCAARNKDRICAAHTHCRQPEPDSVPVPVMMDGMNTGHCTADGQDRD